MAQAESSSYSKVNFPPDFGLDDDYLNRKRTLDEIQGLFLSQSSLSELARRIRDNDNSGQALSIYGIVKGIHAEKPRFPNRAQRMLERVRRISDKITKMQGSGSMISIAGKYVNVWNLDEETGRSYLVRTLDQPTYLRGFAQRNGQRAGFSIPVTPDYKLDPNRPLSASITHRDGTGSAFNGVWVEGQITQAITDYRETSGSVTTINNDPMAIVESLRMVTKMSGVEISWVQEPKESEQADVKDLPVPVQLELQELTAA